MQKKNVKWDTHSLNWESGYSQSSSDIFHSGHKAWTDNFEELIWVGSEKVSNQRENSSIITCSIDLFQTPSKVVMDDDLEVDETDEWVATSDEKDIWHLHFKPRLSDKIHPGKYKP